MRTRLGADLEAGEVLRIRDFEIYSQLERYLYTRGNLRHFQARVYGEDYPPSGVTRTYQIEDHETYQIIDFAEFANVEASLGIRFKRGLGAPVAGKNPPPPGPGQTRFKTMEVLGKTLEDGDLVAVDGSLYLLRRGAKRKEVSNAGMEMNSRYERFWITNSGEVLVTYANSIYNRVIPG